MAENEDLKIIAFLCWKWGYGSADMAGTIRAQYPVTYRTVLVPCAGRIGTDLIMRTFGRGADGIMVIGWYPSECDFETGNILAYRQVEYIKEILKVVGLDSRRIMIQWCTAAEGQKYQQEAIEFDKIIRKLGPSPLRSKKGEGGTTPIKRKAKA